MQDYELASKETGELAFQSFVALCG